MPALALAYQKAETLLDIQRVNLQFDGRVILRDVSATIQNIQRPDCVQGQVVCFLGPSGIGKTQLSRIIAGLQTPTAGTVLIHSGLVGGRLVPTRIGMVGMVAQSYPLFEFATVRENFRIARQQAVGSAGTASEAQAMAYATQFGLHGYLDMYPRQLSGGTRQRVAIVRQLLCAGHFLVLDEPFSGLDPLMKQRACALITDVANLDERNTIIIVTHDVTEGLSIADTVWLMGREAGKPGARLVSQYDLAAEGLCWHPELIQEPRFQAFVAEVKGRFPALEQGV